MPASYWGPLACLCSQPRDDSQAFLHKNAVDVARHEAKVQSNAAAVAAMNAAAAAKPPPRKHKHGTGSGSGGPAGCVPTISL